MSRIGLLAVTLAGVAVLGAGCGFNPKESGGGVRSNLGFKGTVECLYPDAGCHVSNPADDAVDTWGAASHANVGGSPSSASAIDDCQRCHDPVESENNDGAFLFTPTSLAGSLTRPIVGCEACHQSASEHYAYLDTTVEADRIYPAFSDTSDPDPVNHIIHYIPEPTTANPSFPNIYHTTSCGPCHAPDQHAGGASNDDILSNQYGEWFGGDGPDIFFTDGHADSLVVETSQGTMTSDVRGLPCAGCHTVEGFVRIQAGSESLAQTEIDRIVSETGDTGLADPSFFPGREALSQVSCVTCHASHQPGIVIRQPFVAGDICVTCHNGRGLLADVGSGQAGTAGLESPRHPQKELFEGAAQSANDGFRAVETLPGFLAADSDHAGYSNVPEGCFGCHYLKVADVSLEELPLKATTGHAFRPRVEQCLTSYGLGGCHAAGDFLLSDGSAPAFEDSTIASFNFGSIYYSVASRPGADHDGDGKVEPFQTEIRGLLNDLRSRLRSRQAPYSSSQDIFEIEEMAAFTATERAAAYNYDFVVGDRSLGMHNPIYVVNLLASSISALP